MTTGQAHLIKLAATELGIEFKEYHNYSGRGMFGRTTKGIVVEGRADLDELERYVDNHYSFETRVDNMGKGFIIY